MSSSSSSLSTMAAAPGTPLQNDLIFRAKDEGNWVAHFDVTIALFQTLDRLFAAEPGADEIASTGTLLAQKLVVVMKLLDEIIADAAGSQKRAPAVAAKLAVTTNDRLKLVATLLLQADVASVASRSASLAGDLSRIRDAKIMFDLQNVMRQHLALPENMRENEMETFKVVSCGICNDRLKAVDLWDIPGFGENRTLDERANVHLQEADVVICLIPKAQWTDKVRLFR
eukprot:TRINITY_DN4220_c0_g2_i1.p1 TRINITY_DN4220_c0_g2~~TRINITY_DN4220_c0_g2_i1.p1  ORF type:complete len:228 (-),score=34.11 TRINITY_DN4220_c0_g2_i1:96-779(-)